MIVNAHIDLIFTHKLKQSLFHMDCARVFVCVHTCLRIHNMCVLGEEAESIPFFTKFPITITYKVVSQKPPPILTRHAAPPPPQHTSSASLPVHIMGIIYVHVVKSVNC